MILVQCEARSAWVLRKEKLTTGSAGIEVQFLFDDRWTDLVKFATFQREDGKTLAYAIGMSQIIGVPEAILGPDADGMELKIGVCGKKPDGTIVIPTVYASLGIISAGATPEPAINYDLPTETMTAQILKLAMQAQQAAALAASSSTGIPTTFSIDDDGWLCVTIGEGNDAPVAKLGPVTAFAQEVANGYTGSKADFLATMLLAQTFSRDIDTALAEVRSVTGNVDAAMIEVRNAKSEAEAAVITANAASVSVTTFAEQLDGKQATHIVRKVTLGAGQSAWTNQTVNGVTRDGSTVICQPDPSNDAGYAEWAICGVRCIGQGDGTLSFKADSQTSTDIPVNILILNGGITGGI